MFVRTIHFEDILSKRKHHISSIMGKRTGHEDMQSYYKDFLLKLLRRFYFEHVLYTFKDSYAQIFLVGKVKRC